MFKVKKLKDKVWNMFKVNNKDTCLHILFRLSGVYSETCQISKMERFAKIVNGFQSLTIFAKYSILDI